MTDYTTSDDVDFEMYYHYYTDKQDLIYQVQFFDTFVIYRPASPAFATAINRCDISAFLEEFDEYQGDVEELKNYLRGDVPWGEQPIEVTRLN